jgi:ABC-2 type transport system ATP-binding protein
VGELAFGSGIVVHELFPQQSSLEEAFMRMTGDSVDYSGGALVCGMTAQPFAVTPPATGVRSTPPDGPRR